MKTIIIIGNGIAGITAARHIRKGSNHRIIVVSSETEYFFSRTALMYIYMGHLSFERTKPYENWFWKKNRIELIRDKVTRVDFEQKSIWLPGRHLNYDLLLIASGSKPRFFGWPGQELTGVQGMYHLQDVEKMEKNTRGINRAVIVGGGLIGIEMAEMLHARHIPVTYLVRESSFWNKVLPAEESKMANQIIRDHHVDLRLETELKEIVGDEKGRVRSVITNKDEEIPCNFVGLTIGVEPNIGFLENSGLKINKGIVVNKFLETNIPGVYAAGDCAEHANPPDQRRPVEQVWYTARLMGETVASNILGKKISYQPGIWFNSAKFFEVEYQVYGLISPGSNENEETFYWEHKEKKECLRIVYHKEDGYLLGINLLGIRFRQEVCDQWIRDKIHVDRIMENIEKANFDPELFRENGQDIIESYNKQENKSLVLKSQRGIKLLNKHGAY